MPKTHDRIGPYELLSKLGKGAFGEVWLARNVTALAARDIALKIPLDDDVDLDAIRREAAVWIAASGHTNVLPIIEANLYDGQVVIASEYAPDGSLQGWLSRHGGRAPSIEAALEMTRGILAGLEYLHTRPQKIIHRDLKPDNILLQGATPRITDFGISRVLKSTVHSDFIRGTHAYMAPEAFDAVFNEQVDLWAVGVILHQLLAGRRPFPQDTEAALLKAILMADPMPLPASVPAWLREVVARSLRKNPEERYRTAAELRAALAPTVRVPPPTPTPAPKPQEPAVAPYGTRPAKQETVSKPSRARKGLLAAVVGLVVIAGASYLAMQESPGSTPMKPRDTGNQTAPASATSFTENLNGVSLQMVRVPGGSFLMGSPDSEKDRDSDEGPQHRVTVPGFSIGKHEVTQAQWQAVMNNNPAHFKGDNNRPVEKVSWNDAKAFCDKLSRMTGKTYRLPSEAEWEYACRARTTGSYAGDLEAMAWYGDNSGLTQIDSLALWNQLNKDVDKYYDRLIKNGNKTHPVGQKQANAFGLFDMHGNVWEWCEDVWHDSYGGNPPTDGSAWLSGGDSSFRVVRGGSWYYDGWLCRSAFRLRDAPGDRGNYIGFRVAVSARTL